MKSKIIFRDGKAYVVFPGDSNEYLFEGPPGFQATIKTINKALKAHNACFSFRGHDFQEYLSGTNGRRFAKKVTRRSERRLNRALSREV